MTREDRLGRQAEPRGDGGRATERTECGPESVTELRSLRRLTELPGDPSKSVSSVCSVNSVCSVDSVRSVHSVHSVHSVVRDTLPESAEGWRASLFRFTRALKHDLGMNGANMTEVRPHVEQWYSEASGIIGDTPFSDVWSEVITGWNRARLPAYYDPLGAALATAQQQGDVPPLPARAGYEEPAVALAYRLLFWLALEDRNFFISCRALAERLGVDHTKAWRILRVFEADGVIACLKRGKRPKASRYRWTGGGNGGAS
jgi:hypothetical protein